MSEYTTELLEGEAGARVGMIYLSVTGQAASGKL